MFLNMKQSTKIIRDLLRAPLNQAESRQNDILAMEYLGPIFTKYLPWTSSALRPSAMVVILNDIVIHQRETIVEFGAGISTFFIAQTLVDQPGHLFSVEHDMAWLDIVSSELKKRGLQDKVTLIHAPLVESPYKQQQEGMQREHMEYLWYDTEILSAALPSSNIDLIIVDGPPAYRKEERHARYPALPFIKERLSTEFAVVLDDVNRKGEQNILSHWQEELDINFSHLKTHGNIALAQYGTTYTIF